MDFIKNLVENMRSQVIVGLAVPFTVISTLADFLQDSSHVSLTIGAQNVSDALEGAFTGEISALMLKEVGAHFVLVGHSERRHLFHETDVQIQSKLRCAQEQGLISILCIGENAQQRKEGMTKEVIARQLRVGLEGIVSEGIMLAYEPVWAIGSGKIASPQIAQEIHQFCRSLLKEKWGEQKALDIPILYGGSVKAEHVPALLEESDIDGVLVGGASLHIESFQDIIHNAKYTQTS